MTALYKSKALFVGDSNDINTKIIFALCHTDMSTAVLEHVMPTCITSVHAMTVGSDREKKQPRHCVFIVETCGIEKYDCIPMCYLENITHLVILINTLLREYTNRIKGYLDKFKKLNLPPESILIVGCSTGPKTAVSPIAINEISEYGFCNGIKTVFCNPYEKSSIDTLRAEIIKISEVLRKRQVKTTRKSTKNNYVRCTII